MHCQYWSIWVITKLPNSEESLKNLKQNTTQKTQSYSNKGNNKITELQAILQSESQNS